nr:glycerate kinase [Providencia sp. PROV099]
MISILNTRPKIIISPDYFKESMNAECTANAITKGFKSVFPDAQYLCLPIADGGEGTVDVLIGVAGGEYRSVIEQCEEDGYKLN